MPQEPAKAIPYKKTDAATDASPGKALAVLVLLLGGTGFGLYFIRRRFPDLLIRAGAVGVKNNTKRRLAVLETLRLNQKATLYLVQIDGNEVLLAQCGETVTVVTKNGALAQGNKQQTNEHHA